VPQLIWHLTMETCVHSQGSPWLTLQHLGRFVSKIFCFPSHNSTWYSSVTTLRRISSLTLLLAGIKWRILKIHCSCGFLYHCFILIWVLRVSQWRNSSQSLLGCNVMCQNTLIWVFYLHFIFYYHKIFSLLWNGIKSSYSYIC